MLVWIARRLLVGLITTFVLITIIFFLIRLIPGDPAMALLQAAASPEAIVQVRHQMGLDKTILIQYYNWLKDLFLKGSLGYSFFKKAEVSQLIIERLPVTFMVALLGELMAVILGVSIGFISALRRGSIIDTASMSIAILAVSMPSFWLAINLIYIFSVNLKILPIAYYIPWSESITECLKHLILPCISLAFLHAAYIARIMRSSVLEVLNKEYVVTARSKGLTEFKVLGKHVLRNSIRPVITIIGVNIPLLIAGTVVIEVVFALPGLGSLLVNSILQRDYTVVQGIMILIAILSSLSSITVDILYGVIDPRIQFD